ncbi:hypothetical protein B0H13DRAFT_1895708 [Mycena leptocephala]|nr:hypothetical protein B0H13DRAFT_1895708 [Mycena leptocephala]
MSRATPMKLPPLIVTPELDSKRGMASAEEGEEDGECEQKAMHAERLASNRQSETQLTVGQLWTKTLNTLKEQVSKPFCNINTKSQHASGFRTRRASPRFALETPHQVYTGK